MIFRFLAYLLDSIWQSFFRLLTLVFVLIALFYPSWGNGVYGLPFPWKRIVGYDYTFEVRPVFEFWYILLLADVVFWGVLFWYIFRYL